MRLHEQLEASSRPVVAPLVGYPGARLTGTTLRENLQDSRIHTSSIRAVYDRWRPDLLLPMMDLAVEADALGLPVRFPENESPSVEAHPIRSLSDLQALRGIDPLQHPRARSFLETLHALSSIPDVVHGAYVTGPLTLAGLMMGASNVAVGTLRAPHLVHSVLEFAVGVVHAYARACIEAGADILVVLEPTAVLLSPEGFARFSGAYVQRLVEDLPVPVVLHICGDTTPLLEAMCRTGVDGLSLDSAVSFADAGTRVPEEMVLIGNVDPVRVMGDRDVRSVEQAVRGLRTAMRGRSAFILSTGCDLPLETPLASIDRFMEIGREVDASGRSN